MRFANLPFLSGHAIRRLGRFALSSGVATSAHWALMAILVVNGVDALAATTLGALFGALLNYLLQYRLTFASHRLHREALPRYAGVALLSLMVNGACFKAMTMTVLGIAPAQLLSTSAAALLAYYLYSTEVFHVRSAHPSRQGA